MNLHSNYPFWLMQNGLHAVYPTLEESKKTEVAILGAGITGALAAYYLTNAGFKVTVVDKRHVGMGSTAACTALLQYEIDNPLNKLALKTGLNNALRSYRLCVKAVNTVGEIAKQTGPAGYKQRLSLQYASYKKDVPGLYEEYSVRKENSFAVNWLEAGDIKDKFGIKSDGAILSGIGAEIDPYLFTHNLFKHAVAKGCSVYDSTEVVNIQHNKRKIVLTTHTGNTITARHLVIATGYESEKYLHKKVQQVTSTYAIISKPLQQQQPWYKNALIWETARPYNYIRTVPGGRILIGGKDDDFSGYAKREAALKTRAAQLLGTFNKLMPAIPFVTDFAWAGAFGSTKDGLPYIGQVKGMEDTFFTLGYGGNGVIFSVIAAEIITDLISGKNNEDAALFSFYR